jgi:hypothetical protein
MRVRHERSLKIGQARAQAQGRSQKEKGFGQSGLPRGSRDGVSLYSSKTAGQVYSSVQGFRSIAVWMVEDESPNLVVPRRPTPTLLITVV